MTKEIQLKRWLSEEAERAHVGRIAIWYRLRRGKRITYPGVTLRSVNKRVVFVTDNRPQTNL